MDIGELYYKVVSNAQLTTAIVLISIALVLITVKLYERKPSHSTKGKRN